MTSSDLDLALSEWVAHLHTSSGSRQRANNAISCLLLHRPSLRRHLPLARLTVRGWTRLNPPMQRPPLTWELTVLIATILTRTRGLGLLSLGLLLAFHCLLRASELSNLRVADVALPGDPRMGSVFAHSLLLLPYTKTGRNQSVPVRSRTLTRVLRTLTEGKTPTDFVFGRRSTTSMRHYFRAACSEAGLGAAGYTLHSLRHGGATHEYLNGLSV